MSSAHASTRTRLAVDIGGTFTDVALEYPGGLETTKVLTTPHAPQDGVLDGVGAVLASAGIDPAEISFGELGYTREARASYLDFCAARDREDQRTIDLGGGKTAEVSGFAPVRVENVRLHELAPTERKKLPRE